MPLKASAVVKSLLVVGVLIWAGRTVPYWDSWASSLFKMKPAQMCSAGAIVDRITAEIRDATRNLENIYGGKPAPHPSMAPSEPNVSVIVDGILAVDYNSDIDRVKCEITFRIDGAERTNAMAMLQGQGLQRKITYFVQADGDGHLAVSW
jgi:hypothetical protein